MKKQTLKLFEKSGYILFFDKQSGLLIRNAINAIEPFWNLTTPELLDISITNYCEKECSFCYRKSNQNGKHMAFNHYVKVIDEASRLGVIQVAIGGGNPNQHPDFINMLSYTVEKGIVPSYTTNGQGIDDIILNATKKYCGAVAVSWYEPSCEAVEAINRFISKGVKTNIHFILNTASIYEAIYLLKNHEQALPDINAIIFLNYKPTSGDSECSLKYSDQISEFFNLAISEYPFRIGFDSCTISFLANYSERFNNDTIDFCEAGRFSAFISEDMKMYPCSFMVNQVDGENLNENSIQEAWVNGTEFIKIRRKLDSNSCNKCGWFEICHGGCPIFDINRDNCFFDKSGV